MNEENKQTRQELLAALRALDKEEGKVSIVETSNPVEKDEPLDDPSLMKQANIVLALHKDHTIIVTGVTPAQLQLLTVAYFSESKGKPIMALTEMKPVKRTAAQDVARLKGMYGTNKTNPLFGVNAQVPLTFHDAYKTAIGWASATGGFESTPMVGRNLTATEAAASM